MKITVDFQKLHDAVDRMGAKEKVFILESNLPRLDPIDIDLKSGIEVEIGEITVLENGLLSYKGRQVLLYIQDHAWRVLGTLEDGSQGNKYHVSYCETLKSMHEQGRYDRYVAKHDISGKFYIDGKNVVSGEHEKGEASLCVCKNCLRYLNYKAYEKSKWGERDNIFNEFSLEIFFENYRQYFEKNPKYKAGDNESTYSDDWREISLSYRKGIKWKCEICKVNLASDKGLLHVHHKNGVKPDNATSNLEALCIICHKNQPGHSHMNVSDKDKKRLKMLCSQQRIP